MMSVRDREKQTGVDHVKELLEIAKNRATELTGKEREEHQEYMRALENAIHEHAPEEASPGYVPLILSILRRLQADLENQLKRKFVFTRSKDGELKVVRPPAHLLVSVAKFLLSKATYSRYIEPHILDIRHEHFEALKDGEFRKAKWIVIRGHLQALWPLVVAAWATLTALVKSST